MKYKIINQKNGETVIVDAKSVSQAMHIARKQMGWTNYGSVIKDNVLHYRYYAINKMVNS